MNIEIANRLVKLRKENGLSQEELAAKIGISRQAVSKWERAEASPDTDNLILLARLYGISLDALLATVQMPSGIPVATVAIDGAENAAILAVQMLALSDEGLAQKLSQMKEDMAQKVLEKDAALQLKAAAL